MWDPTEVDAIDLASWGKNTSILGEELATSLGHSDREIVLCGAGFAEKAGRDFGEFLTTSETRRLQLISAIESLSTGLTLASRRYLTTDEDAAATLTPVTTKLLRL